MWLIIGYGNSLRSDDRFGLEVCKALQSCTVVAELLEIIVTHQLTAELSASVTKATGVIFVDASANLAPGQLQVAPLNRLSDKANISIPTDNSPFSHYCTPQRLLEEAQELYGYAPKGWLCTVGGMNFEFGEQLSSPVKEMLPQAVQYVLKKICQDRMSINQSREGFQSSVDSVD